MARYEHLPIYKAAMELAIYFEKAVRNFSRYNKYTIGADLRNKSIKLYWVKNETRELFSDVEYYDTNDNGLIDRIQWVVPHLSNQTFEIEIIVLNVQSYPTLGGNWTVRFNTTGTANLTIRGFNGTTFSEVPDDSSTKDDLDFLELTCNGAVVNATIVSSDNISIPYSVYKIKRRIEEIKKQLEELE